MLKKDIQKLHAWMIDVRRDFHKHPELGFEEYRTSKKIKEYLGEMGISSNTIAKTGVIANIPGNDDSITIALRADIDGLPIQDKKSCDYASQIDGKMHACGHDVHTTILLGIAKIFSTTTPPCNIRLLFQPAEETDGGAVPIIEEGGLNNVDGILGLHVDSELDVGQIAIKYDAMNASSDMITIEFFGKKGHGAYPSEGIDAIVMAAAAIQNLQTIISRNLDARESAVLSLGTISGGSARNVISDYVIIEGTIRTLDPSIREYINNRVQEIINSTAKMYGGTAKYTRTLGYTSLINHNHVVDIIKESGEEILGTENVIIKSKPNMGVEDFAYYLEKCQGAFFYLGTGNKQKNIWVNGHNDYFDIDEDALILGVELQISNVIKFYSKLKT